MKKPTKKKPGRGIARSLARIAEAARRASFTVTTEALQGFQLLRDPNVVWYGPHPCPKCQRQIVKTGNGAPTCTLDAEDHNHHYPNHQWKEHVCK